MRPSHCVTAALRSYLRYASRPAMTPCSSFFSQVRTASSSPTGNTTETLAGIEQQNALDVTSEPMGEEGSASPRSYKQFMEQIGEQYRHAEPQGWLRQKTPFPMNSSFKPPPPISDAQRGIMWQLFVRDNKEYSVRRLAKRFHLSVKRVDAILRLKGMEQDWKKQDKQLQTGFLYGMEWLLDAQTHSAIPKMEALLRADTGASSDVVNPERSDVQKADMLEQEENRDDTPHRYERLYWETMSEDADEPILPNILQHVKKRAELKKQAKERKKTEQFIREIPSHQFITRPKSRILMKHRKSKPSTRFIDIGTDFINVRDLGKRMVAAARKSRMRAKKAQNKKRELEALMQKGADGQLDH